jgi:capsular polysaccharide export protein
LLRFSKPFHPADRLPPASAKPRIILLQGPVGPFFRALQQCLVAQGFDVIKINFNGGDLFFSTRANSINFSGAPADWLVWLDALVTDAPPAAIILFGDGRPYHVEALQLAADRGIAAWCLEEGYLRPDYITCERGGNNANSPLRQSATVQDSGRSESKAEIGNSFYAMAAYAMLYALAQSAFARLFEGNLRHRQRPILTECYRWTLSLARKLAYFAANKRLLHRIAQGRLRDYHVVALQVHDDLNLRRHGNGWTMERLIDEVTRSFAANAPPHHQLVFKAHPLDRGHRPYRRLVAKAARDHGCSARVHLTDDGPIGLILRHSDGMITVNSTSGLLALENEKPLLVLGHAIYSSVSLRTAPAATPDKLDAFWRRPVTAHHDDVRAFVERMRWESLINGSFYLPAFRSTTSEGVAELIQNGLAADNLVKLLTIIGKPGRRHQESEHERIAG